MNTIEPVNRCPDERSGIIPPAARAVTAQRAIPATRRFSGPCRVLKGLLAIVFVALCLRAVADQVIPPAPQQYFNDYAGVVSPSVASQLNGTLENFERQSSDQILVVIYPKMQSDSSIDDYTVRVARAWKVGQQNKNNGAVLFIFSQDHKMFLEVGYGLEGVLPDATCKRIIDEQIAPRFHSGDIDGGCIAGVDSILAAVKGEYRGNGTTVADRGLSNAENLKRLLFWAFLIAVIVIILSSNRSRWGGGGGMIITGGGWGGFSGGGGGGGGFSGGGFSGGGGSFGGGGAGGSW